MPTLRSASDSDRAFVYRGAYGPPFCARNNCQMRPTDARPYCPKHRCRVSGCQNLADYDKGRKKWRMWCAEHPPEREPGD